MSDHESLSEEVLSVENKQTDAEGSEAPNLRNNWCPNQDSSMNMTSQLLESYVKTCHRFPLLVGGKETEAQLDKSSKILARINLTPFAAEDEEAMEDWLDLTGRKIRQEQLCVLMFQRAWSAAADEAVAAMISAIATPSNHEELVDRVALQLYPASRYSFKLEHELLHGQRHRSTVLAIQWLRNRVARYLRLAHRREIFVTLNLQRLQETLLQSLPESVENEVRRLRYHTTLHEIEADAAIIEAEFKRREGQIPPPMSVFPATIQPNEHKRDERFDAGVENTEHERLVNGRRVYGHCMCCGNKGHFANACRHRNSRCFNCKRLGHISSNCRNFAKKDARGRVKTLVEPTEGGIKITHASDRTQPEKLSTAEDLLTKIRESVVRKNRLSSQRRIDKKSAGGWTRRKPTVEHPELVVIDTEDDADDEHCLAAIDELAKLIGIAASDDPSAVLTINATINDLSLTLVADTGAAKSILSYRLAKLLNLHPT